MNKLENKLEKERVLPRAGPIPVLDDPTVSSCDQILLGGDRPASVTRSFSFLVISLVLSLSCSSSKPTASILATVNQQEVTLEAFQNYLERERWKFGEGVAPKPEEIKNVRQKILDEYIKELLLLQEFKKRNIEVEAAAIEESVQKFQQLYPSEESFYKLLKSRGWSWQDFREQRVKGVQIQRLIQKVTEEKIPLTDDDLKKYYQERLSEFSHPEQVRARQIVTDSKEKGFALRKMVDDGIPFAEVAAKYSLSPDRKQGGDLGWFERGVMPKEFDQVCFSLNAGQVSQVIPTPYGYHVFEVLEHRMAGVFPFESVKEKIRSKLLETSGREVFQQWFEELRRQSKIAINTELLEKIQ